MIINDGSVKTIQDFVITRTVINFLPLLVSEPCFYQITLIFMIYIHPFSHQKHNWRQLSSIFLAHQAMYPGNLFYFHSTFTLHFSTLFYFITGKLFYSFLVGDTGKFIATFTLTNTQKKHGASYKYCLYENKIILSFS